MARNFIMTSIGRVNSGIMVSVLFAGGADVGIRSLHQWNEWLREPKGQGLLHREQSIVKDLAKNFSHGKFGILIGVPEQQVLLKELALTYQVLLTPFWQTPSNGTVIGADPMILPLTSGSADLVLLPHTLEYASRPHALLAEACRIVRPKGYIVVTGFNPIGFSAIKKIFSIENFPKKASFLFPYKVKHWLDLSDFVLTKSCFYQPFGNLYVFVAEARVVPGTPIRLRWKQKLPAFRPTLAGPSIRQVVLK